uniref:Uncharacterized protein n=1 Tax=Rhizophora mucronata TaxID=61149 RepID=A0A2P2R1Q5_RHIMU
MTGLLNRELYLTELKPAGPQLSQLTLIN